MSLRILALVSPVFVLASCATKFTPAQRAGLSTVAIAPAVVKADAYAEPYGGDRKAADNAAMTGTASQTGAIGGIVGSLVGESIAATQDNLFRGKKKALFGKVQANTPQVGPMLDSRLKTELTGDAFFKSRLRATSPNVINSTITSYRLIRLGKTHGELQFAPKIVAEISLKDAEGKELAKISCTGTGHAHPIETYASSASISKEGYQQAARAAISQFTAVLAEKTAE